MSQANRWAGRPVRAGASILEDVLEDEATCLETEPLLVVSHALLNNLHIYIVRLSKQQTGLRIDRVLFGRFQQLCSVEKLRPGEAVESLVRLAVDTGSIADVYAKTAKVGHPGRVLDEVLFRSRLSRLKSSLASERRYLVETGEEIKEPDSEELVRELTELGRRSINEELVKEFETSLTEADKLYEDIERSRIERWIKESAERRSP